MKWIYLLIAIGAETIGTSALKASDGFTRPVPVIITALAYGVSFYFLSQALRFFPVGVAYAIWSGVGVVVISLIGAIFFKQSLDAAALAGIGLIVAGVLVLNLFSRSVPH
jgi:small multidrug resistance pump